jgi:hypothetical protein
MITLPFYRIPLSNRCIPEMPLSPYQNKGIAILPTFAKWRNAKGALHRQSACILGKNLGACPKTRAI